LRYPADTYYEIESSCGNGATTLVYLPFGDQLEGTTIAANNLAFIAPAGGWVEEVLFRCSGAAGSTEIGICLNDNATPVATKTVSVSADTTAAFAFTSATAFSKGDKIHVSLNPTVAPVNQFALVRCRIDR